MNKLSWLIYLGDVSGSASLVFGIVGSLALIMGACLVIAWLTAHSEYPHDRERVAQVERIRVRCGRVAAVLIFLSVVFISGSIGLPSRPTVWMIAASEASEQVANSETGREMLGELRSTIKSLLAQLREHKSN